MDRAADTTNDFFVVRTSLEFKPCLVERLKKLIRALKENSAKLGVAIFRRLAQEDASTR